ncbi:MAG: gluconate 2-dehydrogenase subunit 3 family protein [Bryobacterales bacterium]|nr:gluconate 2-dehydrogenase subunit 3 family protein [Bryobacterales bacterium]
MARKKSTRRRFLGAASGAAAALAGCGRGQPWLFFSAAEAETVIALCEQIIPADQDPGATQAGVIHYIDRQLTGHFRRHQSAYRQGLEELDRLCRQRHGRRFAELGFEQQRDVLQSLQGELKRFFELVIDHTMQGFYGDPRHGGNRDCVSWRMLGLPPVPVRGREHYDLTAGRGKEESA